MLGYKVTVSNPDGLKLFSVPVKSFIFIGYADGGVGTTPADDVQTIGRLPAAFLFTAIAGRD
jgi:hypothetical protein